MGNYFFLGYVQERNDLENGAMHKGRESMHKEAMKKRTKINHFAVSVHPWNADKAAPMD